MKRPLAFIATALAVITLMSPICSAAQPFAPLLLEGTEECKLNYILNVENDYSPRAYISPSDLLSSLVSDETVLHQAELDYLDSYFDEYLTYSAAIPDSLVTSEKEGDGIKVTALPYEYTAKNGKTVIYLPVYVTSKNEKYSLTEKDGAYEVVIPEAEKVSVYYNGSLPLPLYAANRLLNFAYDEAQNALAAAEYLAEYSRALNEYNKYLEALEKYGDDLNAYNSYLSAKALYDEALAAYEKNLDDIESYPQRLAAYENYRSEYNAYLSAMEIYKAEYAAYEKSFNEYRSYIQNLGAIKTSLVTIESIYIMPTNGVRDLYSALQNEELVLMFEKYQSLLVTSFGVNPDDIKYMRQYSDRLNELLRQYAEKRAISEEEAFAFYKKNYSEIVSLFNGLYNKMNKILTPTIFNLVCGKMELEYGKELGEYKKWRIKNVLCHIYLVCLGLDDERTADSTWAFYGNDGDPYTYYFSDLLSQNLIMTDTNAANPSSLLWKAPVELSTAPVMPERPTEVEKPIEPMEMSRPKEPAAVSKPNEPQVKENPALPENFDNGLLLRSGDIISLLEDETAPLVKRSELIEEPIVSVALSVEKYISDTPKIAVYDRCGKIASLIDSLSQLPEIDETYADDRSEYSFLGWSLSPNELIPPLETAANTSSDENFAIYPLYTASARKYKITFSVNGVETVKDFTVGELPTYADIDISMPSDELYDYKHNGFDSAIERVRADKTYVAEFLATDRIFTVSFVMGEKTLKQKYVRGSEISEYPTPAVSYISGASFFEFTEWDKPLSTVTSDTVYTAVYKETSLAEVEGGEANVTDGITEYILSTDALTAKLSELLSHAEKNGKDVRISFSGHGIELFINLQGVRSLTSLGTDTLLLLKDDNGVGYSFMNAEGERISPNGGFRLSFVHGFEDDKNVCVRAHYENGLYSDNVASSTQGGACEVSSSANVSYKAIRKFYVTAVTAENGSIYTDGTLYEEGKTIPVYVYPNSGYVCAALKLRNLDTGDICELEAMDTLTVPSYNSEIIAEFAPIKYTVTFNFHGGSESFELSLGEMPTVPEIPTVFTEDGFYQTFIGWSSPVSIVTGDVTYTAKYFSVSEELREPDDGSAIEALIRKYVIPAATVTAVLIAAAVVIFILMKKKGIIFKKKSPKKG